MYSTFWCKRNSHKQVTSSLILSRWAPTASWTTPPSITASGVWIAWMPRRWKVLEWRRRRSLPAPTSPTSREQSLRIVVVSEWTRHSHLAHLPSRNRADRSLTNQTRVPGRPVALWRTITLLDPSLSKATWQAISSHLSRWQTWLRPQWIDRSIRLTLRMLLRCRRPCHARRTTHTHKFQSNVLAVNQQTSRHPIIQTRCMRSSLG